MSDKPLLLRALAAEETERRPVWIMRQAGRYLPEYRELRRKQSFEDLCRRPELAAEVTLQPVRRFPLDAAIIFADLVTPLTAMGCHFRFEPGPVLDNPVQTPAMIHSLPEPEPEAIAPEMMAALRLVKTQLPQDKALLGFAGSPWSLAAYMVQGRGKEGFPTIRALAATAPELLDILLGKLTRMVRHYLIAQHQAGADAVQIFDTWAGLLSLSDWRRFVKPHLLWLLDELQKAKVPRLLFLLDASHLLEEALALPADGFAFDWRIDLPAVREKLGPAKALQGNIDPAILLAGPDITRRVTADLLKRMPRRGHIVNLGHGILPETPVPSLDALVQAVQAEGR